MEHKDNKGNAIELIAVTDPAEGAFTIQLPKGWQSQAHSVRPYGVHRGVTNARSPDGGTYLYFGDPQLPAFSLPQPQMFPGMPMAGLNPLSQVHPYVPAEPFFVQYVQQRSGQAPGFRFTASAPCPKLAQDVHEEAQRRGWRLTATTITLSFEFMDGGRRVRGRLHGTTFLIDQIWVPDVFGVMTTDDVDPARWDDLLFAIARSRKTNPQWRQQQDQLHANAMGQIQQNEQRAMAQMRATHQQNMGWIQASAQAHQGRMDNLHAAGDAQLQGWYAQQASIDGNHQAFVGAINGRGPAPPQAGAAGAEDFGHRRFLNYITDQDTVVDSAGKTYQVESGHDRYYKHKHDGTYVGADSTVEWEDLRQRFGVNPDDYEEVRVKR